MEALKVKDGADSCSAIAHAGSSLCVVVQFLTWTADIWSFWVELATALERQGQTLLILSPYDPPAGAGWPRVLPIPYAIGHYAASAQTVLDEGDRWHHLIDIDAEYRTPTHPPSRTATALELASAQSCLGALLEELEPDVVLTWAPPFPQSRILVWEARRLEIPAFALERGFLPRTIVVETHDVGFGSDLKSHPSVPGALASCEADPDVVEAMRRSFAAGTSGTRRSRVATASPVVVLLGSCPGFNLRPAQSRLIRLASPWFETFGEACAALRAALPRGARLLARPHQADVDGIRTSRDAPGVVLARDESVRDLVASADLVAVLGGTRTQYEAVLMGTPVLLLSRSALHGTGVAYEFSGGSLDLSLDAALAREGWASRRRAADRLLTALSRHYLYGYGDAPVARGASDLAAFLGRFRTPGEARVDPAPRIARFVSRTAPLLAPYVCDELTRGVRAMAPVYAPYVEAQTVATLRDAGAATVAEPGVGALGARDLGGLDVAERCSAQVTPPTLEWADAAARALEARGRQGHMECA